MIRDDGLRRGGGIVELWNCGLPKHLAPVLVLLTCMLRPGCAEVFSPYVHVRYTRAFTFTEVCERQTIHSS